MRTLTAIAILCNVSAVSAAPVQTFSGDIKIGDNLNTASNLIGTDFDIDGDGVFDINAGWGGILINNIFAWGSTVRAATGGVAFIFASAGSTHRFAAGDAIGSSTPLVAAGSTTPGSESLPASGLPGGSGNFFNYSPPDSEGLRGFAGFSFEIGGLIHHGRMDLELQPHQSDGIPGTPCSGNPSNGCLRVYGYGYDTTPGAEIGAGLVPILASLPLFTGAVAFLTCHRRRRSIDV